MNTTLAKGNIKFNFDTQITENIPFLNNYARRFVRDEDERKDLVSDTILRALDKKEYFHEGDERNFQAWLIVILRNSFINTYRKDGRNATDSYDNEQMSLISELKRHSQEADADSIYYELQELVRISLTPLELRMFMAYVNGYSYEQISEIMEIPVGTIKSKMHFSRNKIKANIKKMNHEQSYTGEYRQVPR